MKDIKLKFTDYNIIEILNVYYKTGQYELNEKTIYFYIMTVK